MKKYLGKYTAFSGECKEKKEKKKMEVAFQEKSYDVKGMCNLSQEELVQRFLNKYPI